MIDEYENLLRSVRFGRPDYIPMDFHINSACWHHYPTKTLGELMADHPMLFPDFDGSPIDIEPNLTPWEKTGEKYIDGWGCVWETTDDGIVGTVRQHPLDSWHKFESYAAPDPAENLRLGPANWDSVARRSRRPQAVGRLANDALQHGHTFQTLADIRGYENLILDMADDEPRLHRLIEMVEEFNLGLVNRYVELGAEWLGYPEDLGMQFGPMLSPQHFRKYIKPSYQRLIKPSRDAGCIIHIHCDGDIRDLADDLIECGPDVLNIQDLVNGIDWIAGNLKGRVCIDLDIDRVQVTRFGSPADIEALIREEVEKLGSTQGGLMMIYGLYPGVPLENINALMDAMEHYATCYS
ncbi:MAG: hypothetical protein JXN61_14995 [Sedimentisphaerales bacterium]|nr:hypothetical protein [Sedimentisphaerales bacterium]